MAAHAVAPTRIHSRFAQTNPIPGNIGNTNTASVIGSVARNATSSAFLFVSLEEISPIAAQVTSRKSANTNWNSSVGGIGSTIPVSSSVSPNTSLFSKRVVSSRAPNVPAKSTDAHTIPATRFRKIGRILSLFCCLNYCPSALR